MRIGSVFITQIVLCQISFCVISSIACSLHIFCLSFGFLLTETFDQVFHQRPVDLEWSLESPLQTHSCISFFYIIVFLVDLDFKIFALPSFDNFWISGFLLPMNVADGILRKTLNSRSFVPPVRDEESETQRKAHAKRVRETRRSTQGVTLEEIKSAEQLVRKKHQQTTDTTSGSSQVSCKFCLIFSLGQFLVDIFTENFFKTVT